MRDSLKDKNSTSDIDNLYIMYYSINKYYKSNIYIAEVNKLYLNV